MKIHIIGGSGTGKTYVSEKISKQYKIPHFDLDNIFCIAKDKYWATR
ncbi:MAG: hypothetical protein WCD89_04380 [Anaerocolumna sp.]